MSATYFASVLTAYPSKLSLYGSVRPCCAGLVAVPLPWPVVVVRLYTKPGCRVSEKLPPDGVMSGCLTK